MTLCDDVYNEIEESLKLLEKELGISIWIASLGGSYSIGTNNKSSDFDIYVIYDSNYIKLPRSMKCVSTQSRDIHIVSCSVDEIMIAINNNDRNKKYPTYLNRTKEEMDFNQSLNMYQRKEYPNSLIYYTIMADVIWNISMSYEECFDKFKEGLLISDVLDFYYTKAYGNYEHFILNQQNVNIRKYITTIQEVLYCKWICDNQTFPPMDVKDLFDKYEESFTKELTQEIIGVYEANLKTTQDKLRAIVLASEVLNNFIFSQLDAMKNDVISLRNKYFTTK